MINKQTSAKCYNTALGNYDYRQTFSYTYIKIFSAQYSAE